MRFLYEYRTSDNAKHSGEIAAPNRETAYAQLKEKGIKPCRFAEAPGFFNKLFGKGKRWTAIAVLGASCLVLIFSPDARRPVADAGQPVFLPRHQIAGLPADWSSCINTVFADDIDRLLARHALPGEKVAVPVEKGACDLSAEWVVTLRRVVAGMREEADGFLALGKSVADLELYLGERLQMEVSYREQAIRRLRNGAITREAVNSTLGAMGLRPLD